MADLGNERYTPSPFLDVLLQVIRNSRIFSKTCVTFSIVLFMDD